MIEFIEYGRKDCPLLVCVPGLLGGPNDFNAMLPFWQDHFRIVALDPDKKRFGGTVGILREEEMRDELFNSSAEDIIEVIRALEVKQAYLVAISLGSKVVYDFAGKFPQAFAGAVCLDVGPGPFERTDLYMLIESLVKRIDLNVTFEQMKQNLRELVVDRNLRSMIQTQIYYPEQKPPARWKGGMLSFGDLFLNALKKQNINDNFDRLGAVDQQLAADGRFIHVLQATLISAIAHETLPAMRDLKAMRIHTIDGASHFMHVSRKEVVVEAVLKHLARV